MPFAKFWSLCSDLNALINIFPSKSLSLYSLFQYRKYTSHSLPCNLRIIENSVFDLILLDSFRCELWAGLPKWIAS